MSILTKQICKSLIDKGKWLPSLCEMCRVNKDKCKLRKGVLNNDRNMAAPLAR